MTDTPKVLIRPRPAKTERTIQARVSVAEFDAVTAAATAAGTTVSDLIRQVLAQTLPSVINSRTAPEATNGKSNETTTAPVVGAVNPLKEDAP